MNLWADRLFFGATVPIIFGEIEVPKAFIEDREKLSGRPFDAAAMKAAGLPMQGQWRAQAAWLDEALGRAPWLAGDAPGLADIAAYMNLWFLGGAVPKTVEALIAGFDRLADWRARVRAIGHGQRSEMTPAEALEVGADRRAGALRRPRPGRPARALRPARRSSVMADDYGREPIDGTLVAANARRVVMAREDPALGRLNVHFPRVGYVVVGR